ncbi:MAG: hypothetical protein J5I47_13255 [Vicingus serpentipes]|nr:hypothetical protein [Vicingus serpentipes]
MPKAINIISFDVPYPANYGGAIDVFYKLKYFHLKGIKVYLHCFEYGRGEQKELENYCESVNYYKRKTGLVSFLGNKPYIVQSRESKVLRENLLQNDFPILFEGLHTCFLLDNEQFKERLKIVRNHNIEHEYYAHLAVSEKSPAKKQYYKSEAKRLKRFEKVLEYADITLSISVNDLAYFQKHYPKVKNVLVSGFHQNEGVSIKEGKGSYVLYHGNLSVGENIKAVEFMVTKVFNDLEIPLVIAGLNPNDKLKRLINQYQQIRLVTNPSEEEMNGLITNAQINFLYTPQATGLKLKLLNVLFKGRFCIANTQMLAGTSLHEACILEDEIGKMKKTITDTFSKTFTTELIAQRKQLLINYSNERSFEALMNVLNLMD